jgi:phenylacetate-CoA ligase
MCVFVGQCREGRYHVRPDYGAVEILRNGVPVAPGEEGEIVCTGFINPAMPLIRYRIGDLGRWSTDGCTCGLDTPILAEILGRRDDVIITPDGREVGRLSPVLKGYPIEDGQYIQDETGRLTVLLVPSRPLGENILASLEKELRKRVGPDLPVAFRCVEAIPRGPGGKFRAVISRYRPQP